MTNEEYAVMQKEYTAKGKHLVQKLNGLELYTNSFMQLGANRFVTSTTAKFYSWKFNAENQADCINFIRLDAEMLSATGIISNLDCKSLLEEDTQMITACVCENGYDCKMYHYSKEYLIKNILKSTEEMISLM